MAKKTKRPLPLHMPPWGVFVLESHHDLEFRTERMSHPFLKVYYVLAGQGTFHSDSPPISCREGDVVLVPIGQSHLLEDSTQQPMSLYVVFIEPEVFTGATDLTEQLPNGRLAQNRMFGGQVRAIVRRLLFEQTLKRPGCAAMMTGLSLELLAMLVRSARRDFLSAKTSAPDDQECRANVEAYVRDLERTFFENTTLDRVSEQLGMSRRRFTQLFREITNTSWLKHVESLKIAHAKRLLRETDRTVLSVAFECGYEDLSNFYRAFKRATNESPQRWRGIADHNQR